MSALTNIFRQCTCAGMPLKATVTGLLCLMAACQSEQSDPTPQRQADVFLTVRVKVAEPTVPARNSRATTLTDITYFEQPVYPCEELSTLRVIIADNKTNKIEGNRQVTVDKSGNVISDNLTFMIKPGKKTIYVVGNEASLPEDIKTNLSTQFAGLNNTVNVSAIINRTASSPLYDAGPEGNSLLIPMSEIFEVEATPATSEADRYQSADIFITRAVTKFTFRFHKKEGFTGEGDAVTAVTINGLAGQQYLFPTNTVYNPAKYTPSSNPWEGRFIESFSVPDNAGRAAYTFNLPETVIPSELTSEGYTYPPALYFTETAGNSDFTCSITYADGTVSDPVTLPNLPSLPRNTHVIVDMSIGNRNTEILTVTVQNWNSEYFEFDYSANVGIATDGHIRLSGYTHLDPATARMVLNNEGSATGTFYIDKPAGARWDAYLITVSGEQQAIMFKNADGSLTDHVSGEVGRKASLDIVPANAPGDVSRVSRLQVNVTLADGITTVPVKLLGSDFGTNNEYLTIIQNPR